MHGVWCFVHLFVCVVYCLLQATPFGAAAEERAVVKRQRRMTPTPDPDSENAASPQVRAFPFPTPPPIVSCMSCRGDELASSRFIVHGCEGCAWGVCRDLSTWEAPAIPVCS